MAVDYIEPDEAMAPANPLAPARRPLHLWVVGIVSLLWNCVGALDYTMSQLRNETYLGASASGMGIKVSDMIAYINSFPAWAHACWALGVWGALAGSALLLAKSRFAVWAFGVSLLGLAGTTAYQALSLRPAWAEKADLMPIVIWSIATFLLIYAMSMRNKGVLR